MGRVSFGLTPNLPNAGSIEALPQVKPVKRYIYRLLWRVLKAGATIGYFEMLKKFSLGHSAIKVLKA